MKEMTLAELAELTHSKLIGSPTHIIKGISDLESATSEDISFLSNPRYENAMKSSQAGAIFILPDVPVTGDRNFLITPNPSEAFQLAIKAFHGEKQELTGYTGIHATAVIHPTAKLGKNVSVGPHTVIDNNATIGDNTVILSGCTIGPGVSIGSDVIIHSRVTIREHCKLGNRVILQPGVVIGSCGFGYLQNKQGHHTKLEQFGHVEIGDDVEIGANTTIDRARFKKTTIGRGTKIDNLVQIAHGVQIGEHSLIISQTGVAGSSTIGNHVILAGQVGVAGHLEIADGVVVAARSGVSKSLTKPGRYGGAPAFPLNEYNRNAVQLRNIGALIDKVRELEEKLKQMEKKDI